MVIFINCIFCLCFAIDVPETYKFIRGQAEFIKDPNQSVIFFR
jgi:glycine betaine/proline transport system permease protein